MDTLALLHQASQPKTSHGDGGRCHFREGGIVVMAGLVG